MNEQPATPEDPMICAGQIRRLRAISWVDCCPHDFRPDFKPWLTENYQVYVEFERRALQVAQHRQHYSARTIAEVIRHETTIGQLGGEFKVNNNQVPDMARLFAMMNPERADLFEFRSHKAAA